MTGNDLFDTYLRDTIVESIAIQILSMEIKFPVKLFT